MSFSFNKFLLDIAAKSEDSSRSGDVLACLSPGSLDTCASPPASSQLPKPQGTLSDLTTDEAGINGGSPAEAVYSRAQDFITATLSNLSFQTTAQCESPTLISKKPDLEIEPVSESEKVGKTSDSSELSTSLATTRFEEEYVYKALSRVPPDMRYKVIPSLVKNLTLKTYGDVRVSDCISSPIMSVRCQPNFTSKSAIPDSIENAAAQVLEANFDAKTQPSTNIEGLVSTVLSLTQAFRKIEDITAIPQSDEDSKPPLTADDIVEIVGPIKFEEGKPKVWREGMQLIDNKDDSSKTVFMTQNLNKQYEKDDIKKSRTSFEIASAKIIREVGYFSKILDRAGSDMRDTEYSLDPIRVLDARQNVKDQLMKLKGDIDVFISSNLEGDIREKPDEKLVKELAGSVKVEYVYPNEKKLQGKDQKIVASQDGNQTHVCTDCKEEIVVPNGSNLEEELLKHTHGEDNSTNVVAAVKSLKVVDKKERKANEAKHKRAMFLNKLVPCLIDDNLVSCVPCGVNFESDNAVVGDHMDSDPHIQNLNQYNIRVQKELIIQNPDIFGPQKIFYLTDLHIVMNKIFVDPMSKYAYCGLCRKELPPRQQNVEEHIKSKGHDKLLLDFLEGKQPIIASIRTQVPDGAEVKIAQMLDMTEQPAIDISQLEKFLETKARKKSPQQEDDEIASNSSDGKNDHIYRTQDKKLVCLICDTRNIANNNALEAHHSGSLHRKNLEASKTVRSGLSPDQQALMVQNGVAVSYGKLPLIFECLACSASYANYETMLRHFNGLHAQNLARVRSKQAATPKKNNSKPFHRVILHRNGNEFWCFKCRMTLPNIGAAFEHIKVPGHEDTVDGVKYTTATQFFCSYCSVKINGERNVGQHVMGPKHKAFASADNNPTNKPANARTTSESSPAPSFSRAQVKKQKDEKNSAHQVDQYKSNTPYQLEQPKSDEGYLLQNNGVLELSNGLYDCAFCGTGPVTRSEIFHHIFAFDHVAKMSKLGAR